MSNRTSSDFMRDLNNFCRGVESTTVAGADLDNG